VGENVYESSFIVLPVIEIPARWLTLQICHISYMYFHNLSMIIIICWYVIHINLDFSNLFVHYAAKEHPDVFHSFDTWHGAKNLGKKLGAVSYYSLENIQIVYITGGIIETLLYILN